jgi:probable HAF family extracellular repeat protein
MKSTAVGASPSQKPDAVDAGTFEVLDLGPFQNNNNSIVAVNDHNQFAGVALHEATGKIEAFRQEGNRRTALGTLGGSFSIARGLNDLGEVVGGSLTRDDENFHGFLFRHNKLYDLNDLLDQANETTNGWEMIQALGINNRGEILGIAALDGSDRIVLLRPKA